jgi:diguanylate cyclase
MGALNTRNALPGERETPAEDRQAFLDALENAIRLSIATAAPAALVLIDLNNFSEVNGAWGVAVGDALLAATVQRVANFAAGRLAIGRDAVLAGRLDGDHFGIIVPDFRSIEATSAAVAELIQDLARPLTLSGHPVRVSARSVIIPIPEHGRSVTSVLGRGFRLLNSRARGRSDGVLLVGTDAMPTAFIPALERDLAAALASDQLSIVLQPKFEIATGLIRGAEVLIRRNSSARQRRAD